MSVRTLSHSLKPVLSESICGLVISQYIKYLVFYTSIFNMECLHAISQPLLTVFTTFVFCTLQL